MANKAAMKDLQAKEKVMQDEIEMFKKLQKGGLVYWWWALFGTTDPRVVSAVDLQKYTASRMQLDTQINENKTVKEVTKLPTLTKQQHNNAPPNLCTTLHTSIVLHTQHICIVYTHA